MTSFLELREENAGRAERLAYIDFKLRFSGIVKRSDINEMFALKDAAASKLLQEYSKVKSDNMEYNRTLKANAIKRKNYTPILTNLDAETALGMLANGFNRNKINPNPNLSLLYEKIDKIPNQLSINDVAKITRAISGGYAITCEYKSEHSTDHDARTLLPLAIMHDGITWMFRACHRKNDGTLQFKNFHFARCKEVVENYDTPSKLRQPSEELTQDISWNTRIPLQLKLHPSRDSTSKRRIRLDFGMPEHAEEISLVIRHAYLWILEKKWFIDNRDPMTKAMHQKKQYQPFFKFELLNREMLLLLEQEIKQD